MNELRCQALWFDGEITTQCQHILGHLGSHSCRRPEWSDAKEPELAAETAARCHGVIDGLQCLLDDDHPGECRFYGPDSIESQRKPSRDGEHCVLFENDDQQDDPTDCVQGCLLDKGHGGDHAWASSSWQYLEEKRISQGREIEAKQMMDAGRFIPAREIKQIAALGLGHMVGPPTPDRYCHSASPELAGAWWNWWNSDSELSFGEYLKRLRLLEEKPWWHKGSLPDFGWDDE